MPLDLHPFFDAPFAAAQTAADAYDGAWLAKLAAESDRRAQAEQRAAGLQSQLDTLRANPPAPPPSDAIPLTPTTVIEAGKTYRVPNGRATPIVVDKPGVTLVGDGGIIVPTSAGPAVLVTAPFCTIRNLVPTVPLSSPPAGKLNVKPAIRTVAPFTRIINCHPDLVDAFVEAMTGCTDLLMIDCSGTENLRAGFLYAAGAKRVTMMYCTASESQTENLVRSSPDGDNVTSDFTIAFNDLANDANGAPEKSVIDLRSVKGALVWKNALRSIAEHSCVGIGRGSNNDPGPGGTDIRIVDNDCYEGSLSVHMNNQGVALENNRAHWTKAGVNGFITADGRPGQINGLRIVGNRGLSPVAQKALVQLLAPEKIAGLEQSDNLWTVGQ